MTTVTGTCERCGKGFEQTVQRTADTGRGRSGGGLAQVGRFAEVLARVVRFCSTCSALERMQADQARQAAATAADDREFATRLRTSGLPSHLVRDAMPATAAGRALDLAQRFGAGQVDGVLLTGAVGVGKTTLAGAAFARRLRNKPGYWRSAPGLLADLSAGMGTAVHGEALGVLTGRRMLGLDDLDKARPTEYAAEQLYAAIDNAYIHRLPLIVTTNLELSEIADRWPHYGEAIASRLNGYCHAARVTGPDRRKPLEGAAA
jgi:DNA replication protein DnaC